MSVDLAWVGDVVTVSFSMLIGVLFLGQSGFRLWRILEACEAAGAIYSMIDRVCVSHSYRK